MKVTGAFLAVVSALMFFGAAASAGENVLLAVNKPVRTGLSLKTQALAPAATSQLNAEAPVSDDFDAFSAVNDPLYREGSKEFLEQVSRQDAPKDGKAEQPVKKEPVKEALRDAPVSKTPAAAVLPAKVQPVIKKSKLIKVIPADPVKASNAL